MSWYMYLHVGLYIYTCIRSKQTQIYSLLHRTPSGTLTFWYPTVQTQNGLYPSLSVKVISHSSSQLIDAHASFSSEMSGREFDQYTFMGDNYILNMTPFLHHISESCITLFKIYSPIKLHFILIVVQYIKCAPTLCHLGNV